MRNIALGRPLGIQITVAVVVRDAANALADLIEDIRKQDLPRGDFELLIIDGNSTDDTAAVARRLLCQEPELNWRVITNPNQTLPYGWNIAITQARFPILVRIDVHARIESDFLSQCTASIASGHNIVGGTVRTIASPTVPTVARIGEISRFCGSAAPFRRNTTTGYVDTLGYAAYRREIFGKVGGFDERLTRNQDNEMHHRMRKAGYQFYLNPSIRAQYKMRESFRKIVFQKYANGYWGGIAWSISPGCMSARHLAPLIFAAALATTCVLGVLGFGWIPLITLLAAYVATGLFFGASDMRADRIARSDLLLVPTVSLPIHLAYGAGTLMGLLATPRFRYRTRNYRKPEMKLQNPCEAGKDTQGADT